ncbi:MAG: penicillin acylase family protein [Gemmatimonadota bacterium]|jgi:acyl-homoserine-lactone acylase
MKKLVFVLAFLAAACGPQGASRAEVSRWEQQAQDITITRDDWGIAHVRGATDADAVFGMIYAQAEDDFNRVEVNYLNSMGRLAEAEGEGEIYRDLRMKLFIDPDELKTEYAASPDWLKKLMDAWADGLNYYLYTHPETKPKVITRFEPWMALSFTEGSIGGDIERISIPDLQAFYGDAGEAASEAGAASRRSGTERTADAADRDLEHQLARSGEQWLGEPSGSNGFAIAPSNTVDGHALLLINPHTSFFFRSELQMASDEGLDAYGAVTWGQIFIYQGFNEDAGWMHTSSHVDNIDEFAETVVRKDDGVYYRYGDEDLPMTVKQVAVPYKTDSGMATKEFTVYFTRHGPVVREADGKWITVALMKDHVNALIQSYSRTKAHSYQEFIESMKLHTNSSNNTVFADSEGDIAYFHSNFIPRRDTSFDWTKPVDGSNPATDWGEPLSMDETPDVLNPPVGWIQNTNNWPWSVSGPDSPKRTDYPAYVESGGENPRGIHAVRVLKDKHDFTLESLRDAAFDSYLTAFEPLIPSLLSAYDRTPSSNPLKAALAAQIDTLRNWDLRWDVASVPTALAVFWGTELMQGVASAARSAGADIYEYMAKNTTPQERLEALKAASDRLEADFGGWTTPWGEINRYQRINGDIVQPFSDDAPSIPVGFTSSRWGSLASFGARPYPGTKRWYGTSGNSFVAVVEFGDSVRAIAVTAGGESGHPESPHFNDEAERYATGDLREVYYYPSQLEGHTERVYHPGG